MIETAMPRRLGAALVPLLLLAACGGGGGGKNPPDGKNPSVNQPPVVKMAAPEGEVMELSTVTLSAAESLDPDGDVLSFEWKQVSGPAVSTSATHNDALSFTLPKIVEQEIFEFEVTVGDGNGHAVKKTATVTAREAEAIVHLQEPMEGSASAQSLWLLHPALEQPLRLDEASDGDRIRSWQVSPDRQWLAYVLRNEAGTVSARLAAIDGSMTVAVLELPHQETAPDIELHWTADANALLLRHRDGTYGEHAYQLSMLAVPFDAAAPVAVLLSPELEDLDGNGSADGGVVSKVIAAPSGDRFVFQIGNELIVSDSEGEQRVVVDTLGAVRNVKWSFDGEKLAFHAREPESGMDAVYVADAATENSVQEVSGLPEGQRAVVDDRLLQWAPDSHRLAFVRHVGSHDSKELFVVDAAAADPASTRQAASGDAAHAHRYVWEFHWAPDGGGIAFLGTGFDSAANALLLLVSRFTETGITRTNVTGAVVEGGSIGLGKYGQVVAWSPDSRYLAFIGRLETPGKNQVYLTRADGGESRKTAFDVGVCAFDDDPSQQVEWSADSRFLLTDCWSSSATGRLMGAPAESPDPVIDRVNFIGEADGVRSFATIRGGDRIIATGKLPDSENFELLEVTEATAGQPRRLLPAQDPTTTILEFSLIGPGGIVDRR